MPKKKFKKVKDLVEMLKDPDSSGYIGSDVDELDLYDQELMEYDDEDELDFDYDEDEVDDEE